MSERNEPERVSWLVGVFVIARVAFFLVIWIVLFLGMFLGYFTFPILMIGAVVVLYALSDVGLYVAVRRTAHAFRHSHEKEIPPPPATKESR